MYRLGWCTLGLYPGVCRLGWSLNLYVYPPRYPPFRAQERGSESETREPDSDRLSQPSVDSQPGGVVARGRSLSHKLNRCFREQTQKLECLGGAVCEVQDGPFNLALWFHWRPCTLTNKSFSKLFCASERLYLVEDGFRSRIATS